MIELRHVTKEYGPVRALADVCLRVEAGEAVALIGPNGSGKTTALKCIAGLAFPTAGSVRTQGGLSYLPQQPAFDDHLTCREVLEFFVRLRKLPARRADQVLEEWLPGAANRQAASLSGGMAQRLAIAVAALPDAPVLLLDEPTASLDPAGVLLLRTRLREWRSRGKAILFASHLPADAEAAADRVAILVDGRIAALESMEALRRELRSASLEQIYLRYVDEATDARPCAAGWLPRRAAKAR